MTLGRKRNDQGVGGGGRAGGGREMVVRTNGERLRVDIRGETTGVGDGGGAVG